MTRLPEFIAMSLKFNIYRAGLLLRREFFHALTGQGITPEQWQVMALPGYAKKPISRREITVLSSKDKHTISRIIAKMKKNGWISKGEDSGDGRIRMIQLTEAGRLPAKKIPAVLKKRFTGIRQTISLEEK